MSTPFLPDFDEMLSNGNGNVVVPTRQVSPEFEVEPSSTFQTGLQTDSVPRSTLNSNSQIGSSNPIFRPFNKDDFDYVTLKTIDDQLGKRDIAQLKFLCHEWIPGSEREEMSRGFDLFGLLCKRRLLSHTKIELLAELLYRIGRKDILKKIVTSVKEYENFLSRTPSDLSNYRILLHEIAEDTDSKDLKMMKFTLGRQFTKPKLSPVQDAKELFIMMEKKELLGPDNLDHLIDLMKQCNKEDMIMKINTFKGAWCQGNPLPLDQWKKYNYASNDEPRYANGEAQFVPRGLSMYRGVEDTERIVLHDLNEMGIQSQIHPPNIHNLNLSRVQTSRYIQGQQYDYPTNDSIDGDLPCYKMTANPRGFCIIINNYDFYKDPNFTDSKELKPREGSTKDKEDLTHAFTKLKFEIKTHDNVSAQDMINIFHHYALRVDHTNYDCFACCILTHGRNQQLYGSDGRLIDISDLTNFYKANICPSLIDKPKLFFIQACQGREKQEGYPVPKNIPKDLETDDGGQEFHEKIPNEADFLLAFATLPGFVSYRSRSHGSWFVNALVENLNLYAHKYDLLSIMIKVNEEVSKMIAPMAEDKEYKQVPVPQPTLRKKIYFR